MRGKMEQIASIYQNGITEIVAELFQSMLATEVSALPSGQEHSAKGHVTALVSFGGTWRGVLEFECGSAEAVQFARRFLQTDEFQECNADVRDSLGELANIVAGNLKALMAGQVTLCTPSVVEGSDYSVRVCGGTLVGESWFKTDVGTFAIRLLEDTLALGAQK